VLLFALVCAVLIQPTQAIFALTPPKFVPLRDEILNQRGFAGFGKLPQTAKKLGQATIFSRKAQKASSLPTPPPQAIYFTASTERSANNKG